MSESTQAPSRFRFLNWHLSAFLGTVVVVELVAITVFDVGLGGAGIIGLLLVLAWLIS